MMAARRGRTLLAAVLGTLVLLGAIQLIPYRQTALPSTRTEPRWDSPRTRELVVRACFDCHSNEVVWPWYANVAPVSWVVRSDVDRGRRELNFSEWGARRQEGREVAGNVAEGEMPPPLYTLVQRKAVLSASERAELIAGLTRTLGSAVGDARGGDED